MSYIINAGDVSHVECVQHETMLHRRRLQISNEMADDEVGLDGDHVIIRTCDVLEMRRPQHRADSVGETRCVGESEMNSRSFV